ncbi:MAG: hypothetical protein Tsb009_33910 [Planctomycetaceae bacterium]
MAAQFAVRTALIAFAVVSIRGVIERAMFYGTISTALEAACLFLVLGLIVGELAGRTAEELARADLEQMMESLNGEDKVATSSPTAQQ